MSCADQGCREPVYDAVGNLWATRTSGPHDWRLLSREQMRLAEFEPQKGAPGYGTTTLVPTGWREVWFCTKCRCVDEREVVL